MDFNFLFPGIMARSGDSDAMLASGKDEDGGATLRFNCAIHHDFRTCGRGNYA